MQEKKIQKVYYFSVEGDTEKMYLDWLQKNINAIPDTTQKVKIISKIEQNPVKFVKGLSIMSKTEIWHLTDYESDEEQHAKDFQLVLDRMLEACNIGKNVKGNTAQSDHGIGI